MASTTLGRAKALKTETITHPISPTVTFEGVPNFAIFIDTHRDQPHVGSFETDIHRGMTRPTLVHYIPPDAVRPTGALVRAEDWAILPVHDKHKFVETSWWQDFVVQYMFEHGESPVSGSGESKGQMPTSHLRDARAKVYKLKSLRQIVRAWEAKAGT